MEFKEYRLEEICHKIGDGIHGTPNYNQEGDYYFINGNNLENGKIVIKEDTKRVNYEEYIKHKRELNINSILISINGTLGNIARFNQEKCILGKSACYVNIKEEIDSNYIKYVFMSPYFQKYLFDNANGTTIKNVPLSAIRRCSIKIPSLENQKKIAKVLSDIDKKLELNNKLNDNLLEISQSLYKRWFIDFEFPNDDGKPYKSSGGKMINSELGMIPENWEIGFIGDGKLTKIIKSGVAKFEKNKKYIATADVEGTTIKSFTFVDYNSKPSRANMTPIPNSVWFAKMQDSVKNMIVDSYMINILDNYIFSTGFMGVECLKNSIYYIWNYINSDIIVSLKNNLSTGTLMAGISNTTIVGCKYVIPVETILNLFNNEIQKLNESIYNNDQENETLIKLRDTLLPKLMNGEIDLEKIEI